MQAVEIPGQSHCLPWCQAWCGIVKVRERFICILCSKLSVFHCQKVFSFLPGQKKIQKCTWMVEFRGSRDSGTGRTLCQGEDWLWQVIRECQHRACPPGLFCCKVTPHFSAQNCSPVAGLFPAMEEWRRATQTLRDCWNKNVIDWCGFEFPAMILSKTRNALVL